MIQDPIHEAERLVKGIHDSAHKYTNPTLKRYPLLFSTLLVFAAAAFIHGFELWADTIPLFSKHPLTLIGFGMLILFFTGRLYKTLENMHE